MTERLISTCADMGAREGTGRPLCPHRVSVSWTRTRDVEAVRKCLGRTVVPLVSLGLFLRGHSGDGLDPHTPRRLPFAPGDTGPSTTGPERGAVGVTRDFDVGGLVSDDQVRPLFSVGDGPASSQPRVLDFCPLRRKQG